MAQHPRTPHGETAYSPSSILRALTQQPLDVGALREDDVEPRPPRRTRTALPTVGWTVLAIALGLLVGVGIVDQRAAAVLDRQQREELIAEVTAKREAEESAARRGAALREEIRTAEDDLVRRSGAAGARLSDATFAAGTVAVSGPGAVITLDDSAPIAPRPGESTTTVNRVTDGDLQLAVNALWESGAEAIAVNGVPVTGRTAIRSAGRAVLVDLRSLSPPYRIEAIGDTEVMLERFPRTVGGEELERLSARYGIVLQQEPTETISIPAGTAVLRHARPVGSPDAAHEQTTTEEES